VANAPAKNFLAPLSVYTGKCCLFHLEKFMSFPALKCYGRTWRHQKFQNMDIDYFIYLNMASLVLKQKIGTTFSPPLIDTLTS